MICNYKLGFKDKSKHHSYVFEGLIDSIINNGDGKTKDTAFTTLSTRELHTFLRVYNLKVISQSLQHNNYKSYDVMTIQNTKSTKHIIYFDITKQLSQINKL
jgi:hypothetical protein